MLKSRLKPALSLYAAIQELQEDAPVVELEFSFSTEELEEFSRDPKVFMSQAAVKKRAEVSMRNASAELKESMREAKMAEIGTWLENEVCAPIARASLDAPPMRLRWVLTVKKDSGKAKARLVALGFQDADLGNIRTESPTASRRARSLYLQCTVNKGWRMCKADAKGAFLQGRLLERKVAVEPVPELREAYN